ncbi:MAG TPA: IS21-like element helper ATPase IstB [Kofleriaceae bacterium]|nr:IS21-like element helper ATPase IstB [Kofleriaceae bacterium]
MSAAVDSTAAVLPALLRVLRLPTVARCADEVAVTAAQQGWSFTEYLRQLVELEIGDRTQRRIERNLLSSDLPGEKTLATLDRQRLPAPVAKQLPVLCDGAFLERGDNVLLFGLPGRGKTHLACALGNELVRRGHRILFSPTYALVQRLLAAKRDLRLEKYLTTLDGFDAIILDDLGYVQQSRDEMEVLFTFLAERYERRSVIITSNLVFSEWNRIFQDPMTTAAAIDRLVHHAVILELSGTSVRAEHAKLTQQGITTGPTSTDQPNRTHRTHRSPKASTTQPPITATVIPANLVAKEATHRPTKPTPPKKPTSTTQPKPPRT